MKHCLLASIFVLLLAAPASAAIRDFGRFTADVPDNWVATVQNGAAVITSGDGKAGLSVLVRNAQGRSAQDVAQAASLRNGGTPPVQEAGGYSFTIQKDGDPAKVYVTVTNDEAMLVTVFGGNIQTGAILQSIRMK